MNSDLLNSVVTNIDLDNDRVRIELENGSAFIMEHDQECCESVYITDGKNEMRELVGYKIVDATCEVSEGESEYGSATKTDFTFKTDEKTVVLRWFGESNGYYSESVDFYREGTDPYDDRIN